MKGKIDHVLLNCIEYDRALEFYSWLLPKLGFKLKVPLASDPKVFGWIGRNTNIWLSPAGERLNQDTFDKARVGLRELAFAAETRAEVDDVAKDIEAHGGHVTDPPREYAYWPGYYSVFFTDPDGIKLEVVHNPQHDLK